MGPTPPIQSENGLIYECIDHRKGRIIKEQTTTIQHALKPVEEVPETSTRDEPGSPAMPHLETAQPITLPDLGPRRQAVLSPMGLRLANYQPRSER